jgi:hypothetical protein
MSRWNIGHIQRRILTTLETCDDRYITKENRELRWLWVSILIILVYHPNQLSAEKKRDWDWGYSKNEARRIWESIRGLERRQMVETRIMTARDIGIKGKFGGCTRWKEVRLK